MGFSSWMGEAGAVLVADAMSLKLCTDPERDVDTLVWKEEEIQKLVGRKSSSFKINGFMARTADSDTSSINQASNWIISWRRLNKLHQKMFNSSPI